MIVELPHPAAVAARDLTRRRADGERLDTLLLAFESLLRVECALGAGRFLESSSARDDRARDLLTRSRYHLGDWYSLLQTLVALGCVTESVAGWFRMLSKGPEGSSLLRLVELRNLRAHDERRTSPEFIAELLNEAAPLFDVCWAARASLPRLADDAGRVVVIDESGATSAAGPFLLPGSRIGRPQEVLMFRGASSNSLGYTTHTGREHWCRESYAVVAEGLRRKVSLLERVDAGDIPDLLAERVRAVTDQSLRRFEDARRFRPEVWVDRTELDGMFHAFLEGEDRVLVVEGLTGSGRTAWLCATAARRRRAGALTLVESADRLGTGDVLGALASSLRVSGELGNALDRLGDLSGDGVVAVFLHDLSAARDAEELLRSVLLWSERMRAEGPVRIVVTVAVDWWRAASARLESALAGSRVRVVSMPPLRVDEIEALATRLANASDALLTARERSARIDLARRLGAIGNASARRPAMALSILELASGAAAPESLSARAVYEQIFARDIVAFSAQQVPRFPLRGALVRRVAASLLGRRDVEIPLEDAAAEVPGLVDASGARSPDYDSLLAGGVFVERVEEFSARLAFTDTGLMEFAAALDLPLRDLPRRFNELLDAATTFEPALGVAGHLLLRAVAREGGATVAKALLSLSSEGAQRVLAAAAMLDADAYLGMMQPLCPANASLLLDVSERLLEALGESRTAAAAAATLTRAIGADRELRARAWALRLRALYLLDEYDLAERELRDADVEKTPRFLATLADFASSRRDFTRAEEALRELLAMLPPETSMERAIALRSLGYVEMETGRHAAARTTLERSLAMLDGDADRRAAAEVWSELGELAMREGRFDDARDAFEQSNALNRQIGSLVGLGIVEGFFGELELRIGHLEDAERRLGVALSIHRRVANRWREAWTLRRLARLHGLRGDPGRAEMLEREARGLEEAMGFVTADPSAPAMTAGTECDASREP